MILEKAPFFKLRGGLSSVISTRWNCTDGCLQTFQHDVTFDRYTVWT